MNSKPLTLWMLQLLIMTLTLVMWPTSSTSQTPCAEPNKCVSGEAVNAAADALCRRARAAEERLGDADTPDTCLGDLAQMEQRAIAAEALLEDRVRNPPQPAIPWRSPWWLRVPLDVALVGVGTGVGAAAGIGAPSEIIVGGVVLELALLGGRLVLEVLDDRARKR